MSDITYDRRIFAENLLRLMQQNREKQVDVARLLGVSREDENRFREILEMAAQVKEETIRRAKEDAEAIRVKAETEAQERLDGLAAERDSLKTEIENLKQTAADYRQKFEELLHAQQDALEKATGLF